MKGTGLSRKQQVFVEEYLDCWNATEAARRVAEKTMSADEVLVRLTATARGDLGEFLSDTGEIDLAAMKRRRATHLLRKVKRSTRSGVAQSGAAWSETRVEVELYSAQDAQALIAKHHGLLVDKAAVTWQGSVTFTADEAAQAQQELDAWRRSLSGPRSSG